MDVQQVDPTTEYKLPEPDPSIRQQGGEGRTHWSRKASVIAWLKNIDGIQGEIEAETKVEDLIADVKCTLDKSVKGIPDRCVFEIQTRESNTSILQRIERFNRHGYTVFYIYPEKASDYRRRLAEQLEANMSEPPILGRITEGGELILGNGVTPGTLDRNPGVPPWKEFYVPTYERSSTCYDFGDFMINSVRTALVAINGYLYAMAEVDSNGQRTLPLSPGLSESELYNQLMDGEITRESPVRGTP
ncbi:hypothetical protein [Halorubrum lipolyticum]|uniref:hypothetical protein n=1 Tax=Halorubrum lipolyticum TaxID=368624 RepID=UPI0011CCA3C7|nr:hypothetical protein [Halorubrum lipolyticum]